MVKSGKPESPRDIAYGAAPTHLSSSRCISRAVKWVTEGRARALGSLLLRGAPAPLWGARKMLLPSRSAQKLLGKRSAGAHGISEQRSVCLSALGQVPARLGVKEHGQVALRGVHTGLERTVMPPREPGFVFRPASSWGVLCSPKAFATCDPRSSGSSPCLLLLCLALRRHTASLRAVTC